MLDTLHPAPRLRLDGIAVLVVTIPQYSGTLAGASRGREQEAEASTDPMQALATMGCDDSLRVLVDAEDEHGNPVQVPAVISARIDADGGGIRWTQEEDEEAAVNAAMGASQMASMLHDTGRIRAFERAIEGAVARFRAAHGRGPVVLDIGAGTGLLSMLAARAGAAAVFACEMYEPMARVARRVVADNGMTPPWLGESSGASGASFESKAAAVDATATAASTADGGGAPAGCPVAVFAKLSTALTVGSASPAEVASAAAAAWSAPAGADARHPPLLAASATDLPCRCDLLVTEILDSALLGEGMVPAAADARDRLLVPGAEVVPRAARMIAALVQAPAVAATRDTAAIALPAPASTPDDRDAGAAPAAASAAAPTPTAATRAPTHPVGLCRKDWSAEPCPAGARSLPMHTPRLGAAGLQLRSGALQIAEWNFSSAGTASSAERMSLPAAETPLAGADCALLWWEALIGVDADGTDVTYCTRPRHPAVAADPMPVAQPSASAQGGEAAASTAAAALAPMGCGSPVGVRWGAAALPCEAVWQDHWTPCLQPLPRRVTAASVDAVSLVVHASATAVWVEVLPAGAAGSATDSGVAASAKRSSARGSGGKRKGGKPMRGKPGRKPASKPAAAAGAVAATASDSVDGAGPAPCVCGLHPLLQPDRVAQLGDRSRNLALAQAIRAAASALTEAASGSCGAGPSAVRVLDVGEHSWTALLAAAADVPSAACSAATDGPGGHLSAAPRVISLETAPMAAVHAAEAATPTSNVLPGGKRLRVQVLQATTETVAAHPDALHAAFSELGEGGTSGLGGPVDMVVSDLFSSQCLQRPVWQALIHLARCRALSRGGALASGARCVPAAIYVRCAAVALPQLRPSFAAAGSVFGFNHAAFDSMRAGWNRARVLSFPLWMYEAAVVSEPATLFALDCSRGAGDGGPRIAGPDKQSVAEALGTLKGAADAVAVWTELDLTGESLLDPAKAPHWDVGEQPSVGWDSTAWVRAGSPLTFARQEVFVLDTTLEAGKRVPWDVQLDLESGKGLVFKPAGI